MRKLNVKTFLASAVVAAMMVAVPASASAAHWTLNGKPFKSGGTQTMKFKGYLSKFYGVPSMNYGCEVAAEATLSSGNTEEGAKVGKITSFEAVPSSCTGNGYLYQCHVNKASATGLPWQLTIEEKEGVLRVVVPEIAFSWTFASSSECSYPGFQFKGELILTPNKPSSISSFTMLAHEPGACCAPLLDYTGTALVEPAGLLGVAPK